MLDEDQQHIGRGAIARQWQDDVFRTDKILMRADIGLGGAMCSIPDIQLPVQSLERWWTILVPISRNRKSHGSRRTSKRMI